MLDEAFHGTQRRGTLEHAQFRGDRARFLAAFLETHGKHAAKAAAHLLFRYVVTGMALCFACPALREHRQGAAGVIPRRRAPLTHDRWAALRLLTLRFPAGWHEEGRHPPFLRKPESIEMLQSRPGS
jgi:hypothetical protein